MRTHGHTVTHLQIRAISNDQIAATIAMVECCAHTDTQRHTNTFELLAMVHMAAIIAMAE